MVEARAIKAGVLYCGMVFAAGFGLGVMRTLFVAPLSGEFVGVLLEAPMMLAISWNACGWVAERLDVPQPFLDRLVVGGVALAMLIFAEAVVALFAENRSLTDYFVSYARSAMLLGLLAQLAFAVFPMVQRRRVAPPHDAVIERAAPL